VTDKVVVLVSVGSLKEGRKLGRSLVEAKLAACVNLMPAMESIYTWQGKIEKAREQLLLVKTSREVFPRLAAEIRKLHSYTTPEVICLPIIDGSAEYLAWLDESLKPSNPEA